jgi:hypothetical protein
MGRRLYLKEVEMTKTLKKNIIISLFVAMFLFAANSGFCMKADITGTVEQKGENIILFTPEDTFVLDGGDMLADMIGKKVTVTGTVTENGQVKVLKVMAFEEVEEK